MVAPRGWDLPGPGVETVSSPLAGRFLITGPPGKSKAIQIMTVL